MPKVSRRIAAAPSTKKAPERQQEEEPRQEQREEARLDLGLLPKPRLTAWTWTRYPTLFQTSSLADPCRGARYDDVRQGLPRFNHLAVPDGRKSSPGDLFVLETGSPSMKSLLAPVAWRALAGIGPVEEGRADCDHDDGPEARKAQHCGHDCSPCEPFLKKR